MDTITNTFLSHSLLRSMIIFRTSYIIQLLVIFIHIPSIRSTTFKYPTSQSDIFELQGNATLLDDGIQLTADQIHTIGRALYGKPVCLWDSATGQVANFSTSFSFFIHVAGGQANSRGDGLAFFLAPNGSTIPPVSDGSLFGLFNENVKFNSSDNPVVAVEFDTYSNPSFDPVSDHVGIDINSIKSVINASYSLFLNNKTNARISYDSSTKNLSVYVSLASSWEGSFISYIVDLKHYLPQWVSVGLTASTGGGSETHQILSWEFSSTEFPDCSSDENHHVTIEPQHKERSDTKLVIGLVVGIALLIVGVGIILLIWQKKRKRKTEEKEIITEYKMGPTKYAYNVLVCATDDFKEDHKLGEGGFGSVYRGTISESNLEVAVKKISKFSQQGKKEFASEVESIGKLVHRNLVQLLGWCQERGEFLLVYEFMPNGSLDSHLFEGRSMLTWASRYKIANGLASALQYLHEGLQPCVLHRDIKSSNIMLDSDLNAKLGDFGLARFADHEEGIKTTRLAGTWGYTAPECFRTLKSSKESDIYSFGAVALEIACGRRVVLHHEEEDKVHLVSWVQELYMRRRLLEAADTKLSTNFDEQQMVRLMVVGLWCTDSAYNLRPSIKQVISVLSMEVALPDLAFNMPLSNPSMSAMQYHGLYSASSSSAATENQGYQSQTSGSTHNTSSTHSTETKYCSAASLPR